jgi:hypothetical protein
MRKILSFIAILGLLSLVSCNKDVLKVEVSANPTAPGFVSPTSGYNIAVNSTDTLQKFQFKWNVADYSAPSVPVTYTLQVDSAGRNFSKAFTIATVSSVDTFSIALGDLNNDLYNNLVLSKTDSTVQVSLEVRVIATLGIYNKDSVISSSVPFTVTTWKRIPKTPVVPPFAYIYIAGDFQGWNIGAPSSIASVTSDHIYEGYVYAPAGGGYKFYTEVGNWSSTSYGDGNNGTGTSGPLIVYNAAGYNFNFQNTNPGYYEIYANLITMTWSETPTTWSIIGDATPGGWNTDTPMTYNTTTQVWTVTANMVKAGSYKFRANDAWVIDFGIDSNGNLAYSDNPLFGGNNPNINNITVPSDGNYTITLDLHNAGVYAYSIVKN